LACLVRARFALSALGLSHEKSGMSLTGKGGDVIDWTKPVESIDYGTPVRVVEVLTGNRAILAWNNDCMAGVYRNDDPRIRNVAPKPREWWADVEQNILHPYTENLDAGSVYVHVREVLPE
jgi:hypothetical protein